MSANALTPVIMSAQILRDLLNVAVILDSSYKTLVAFVKVVCFLL